MGGYLTVYSAKFQECAIWVLGLQGYMRNKDIFMPRRSYAICENFPIWHLGAHLSFPPPRVPQGPWPNYSCVVHMQSHDQRVTCLCFISGLQKKTSVRELKPLCSSYHREHVFGEVAHSSKYQATGTQAFYINDFHSSLR